MWTAAVEDGDALRPYAGGGPGLAFVGGSSGSDAGLGLAAHLSAVAGVLVPVDGRSIFIEGRGNVAFGVLDEALVWLSIGAGLFF